MASVPAVYASTFGFPYNGKTRFWWVAALTEWESNPLDSYSEFQARLYRGLSQRSRLSLAPSKSSIHLFIFFIAPSLNPNPFTIFC